MDYTTPEIINCLNDKLFKHYQEDKSEVWKIRINGFSKTDSYFLKTCKGKSCWNKESFARSAFRNFIENNLAPLYDIHAKFRKQNPDLSHWQNKPSKDEMVDFIKQLEAKGILEFVRM